MKKRVLLVIVLVALAVFCIMTRLNPSPTGQEGLSEREKHVSETFLSGALPDMVLSGEVGDE